MRATGIHIDKPFLRAAHLEKRGTAVELCALKSAPIADPDHVKQLYIDEFRGRISYGVSPQDLLIRPIRLNLADNRYIHEAIAAQSETTMQMHPADILSVPHAIKKKGKQLEATLYTISRQTLKERLTELKAIPIEPDCVSSNSLALVRYALWKDPSLNHAFVIDLGSSEWTCLWMEEKELKKAHSLKGGIEALLSALWSDRKKTLPPKQIDGIAKQIDLLQLKPNLNPHLSEILGAFQKETAKMIYSFYRASGKRPVIFTGRTDAFGHLCPFLKESFSDAICSEMQLPLQSEEEQKFAIPIGLALEQMDRPLQMLQQEFFPAKNWRKAGLYTGILLFLSLLACALLLLSGGRMLDAQKKELFALVSPSLKRWNGEKTGPFDESHIERWIASVHSHNKESSRILQAPKASQVLSWLSKHPLLAALREEGDPMEILQFRYQLTDYPKIGSAARFRAKAEFEFQLKNPMNARRFHEALSADTLIDSSESMEWEANANSYRVAFCLKNEPDPYVP